MPPISACDDDDGRLNHQVSRFHVIAPTRPASTTHTNAGSAAPTSTILAIVLATPVWKMKYATKLKKAAHRTAMRGDSTRVETTVAIEFAASWNPLTTSNA